MEAQKSCQAHHLPIDYICFDDKCINQGGQIMCSKCTNTHNGANHNHRVIEYSSFKKYLQTFRKQIDYDELKEIIRDQFIILRKDINKYVNDLEDSVLSSLSLEFDEQKEFQVFQGQVTLLAKNELFKKFVMNPSSMNLVKQEMRMKSINLMKQIRNLNIEMKKLFQMGQKQIDVPKLDKKFYFSQKSKHQNIQVINNGCIIRRLNKDDLGQSQLAVCKQPFSPINNKIEFHLKEMSSKGCVAIGACQLGTVQKQRFFRCWQFGSGTYSLFMNSFGYVKSNHHFDRRFSDAFIKGWKFKKGDLITVEIDFMKETIIFTKNNTETFVMPVNIGGQKLYPFASVSFMGDMVEIV